MPRQVSELEQTIGREVLLAMTIEVRAQLPRFFGKRRGASLAGDAQAAADAFFREYFSSLGRAGDWPLEEAAQFQRDLDLYARMSPGESGKDSFGRQAKVAHRAVCRSLRDPARSLDDGEGAARGGGVPRGDDSRDGKDSVGDSATSPQPVNPVGDYASKTDSEKSLRPPSEIRNA